MSGFNIHPLHRFAESRAVIRRPKEIACFSYDENHEYHPDERSLRYYYPPNLGVNLSNGFIAFEQLDDTTDSHLDSLLKTIINLEKQTGKKCEAEFITWRGMMTKVNHTIALWRRWLMKGRLWPLLLTIMGGFEMNATRFQNTIFIEENHEYKLESRKSQLSQPSVPGEPSQELMTYWGYKFETLATIPDQWDPTSREYIEGREDMVVNNLAQYCSVVKTRIGMEKMILGGEVDALWGCKPEQKDLPINWVELKTSAEIESQRDTIKYERKLLKFWLQSFLLGVPKIIVGFRSKDGVLQRLELLETASIPVMVKKQGSSWDGNLCIKFTASFLEYLKKTITTEGAVYLIQRKPKSPVIKVFERTQDAQSAPYGHILSPEFIEWRCQG